MKTKRSKKSSSVTAKQATECEKNILIHNPVEMEDDLSEDQASNSEKTSLYKEPSTSETLTEDMDTDDFADNSENNEDELDASTKEEVWANAMSNVLGTTPKNKTLILSKAKKDSDIKKSKKKDVEFVDESGKIVPSEVKVKKKNIYKEKRKEMLEKQIKKKEWENMCRVKPDITGKERERELVRIATKGIVHLFNAVQQHQKSNSKIDKKPKQMNVVKGNFMDVLKNYSKVDPVMKKERHEETWNILKDDFMMGAQMKDWDKESDVET